MSGLGLGLVAAMLMSCSMETDFGGLTFRDTPRDVASEAGEDTAAQDVSCLQYLSCLAPGGSITGAQCSLGTGAVEGPAAGAVADCASLRCGDLVMSTAGFESLGDCLLVNCTDEVLDCAVSQGTETCSVYGETWQALREGTEVCSLASTSMCLIQVLSLIAPDNKAKTRVFIGCLALVEKGFQNYDLDCLPHCR
jgi:hypothetical protein